MSDTSAAPPNNPNQVLLDRSQLDTFQRAVLLLDKLSKGPTRREFEKLVKTIVPEVETTDDLAQEYARPAMEKVDALAGKLDEFLASESKRREEQEQGAATLKLTEAFNRLRSQGLTEKGEEAVRQLMVERSIPDPEAAFALFERQNPKPPEAPAAWEPQGWNLDTNAVERDVQGLFKDPERWGDIEVANVINEIRRAPSQV